MEYLKPPLTYEEQLELLIERGLQVTDKAPILKYLQNISYYRLSAYFLPLKKNEVFKEAIKFDDIMNLYTFDRKLRLLIWDAIEPIEIAIRSQLIYHLSHTYGAFGYLEKNNFSASFKHSLWLEHLTKSTKESTESFIAHYKQKYTSNQHMPIWMALETVSFGGLSRLIRDGLLSHDRQAIAKELGLQDVLLSSWLHSLAYTRNLCAHHARLWNRTLTVKPKLPKSEAWQSISNARIFAALTMIQYLLQQINPQSMWKQRLFALLQEYPQISLPVMGFNANWKTCEIWK